MTARLLSRATTCLPVYMASIIRTIIALHNLLNNKVANKEHGARSVHCYRAAVSLTLCVQAKMQAKLDADRKREIEEAAPKDDEKVPGVTAKEGL